MLETGKHPHPAPRVAQFGHESLFPVGGRWNHWGLYPVAREQFTTDSHAES